MSSRHAASAPASCAPEPLDVESLRGDFPALDQQVHGHPLIYLDNAATTQKPESVLAAMDRFYRHDCSNVHRGVHTLSGRATTSYESARGKVRRLIGAADDREIIMVRGATEGINLVAATYGRARVAAGDEILVTNMEHHSNIVPWQILCEERGATLRVAPIDDRGALCLDEYEKLLSSRTRIVAMTHQSNALGTVNPVEEMARLAHAHGAVVLMDGAQAVAHQRVDVRELDADFYVLSGHKMYGPTGIGVLYGKTEHLAAMPPYQGGGDMILSVTFEKTVYNELPFKFEAGTPNVAGAIGLGAAVDYLQAVGVERVGAHEHDLIEHGTRLLSQIPGVRLIGTAPHKSGVLSFVVEGVHPHDIGTLLDGEGIAVRTGHHCSQPVMRHFDVAATVRASVALYNTRDEMERLAAGVRRVIEVLG
ncbi:MAG: SufS family cysteine desulfurase [Acidobacteriota bacterium]